MTTPSSVFPPGVRGRGRFLVGGLFAGVGLAWLIFVFFDPINLFALGLQRDIVGSLDMTVLGIGLALSFVSGTTMVFTPYGMPLIPTLNSIVSEDRESGRSWLPPLASFTVGIVVVMTVWGIVVSLVGGSVLHFLFREWTGTTATSIIYVALGGLALLMALVEFEWVRVPRTPMRGMPAGLQRLGPNRRSLIIGGLLGGGFGAGGPFPAYQSVLAWAGVVGSPWYGALLLAANGLGRAAPLWPIAGMVYHGSEDKVATRWLMGNHRRAKLASGTGLAVFAGLMIALWGVLLPLAM